jgi:drug/metabolite transporter (DMT)-like permease
MHAIWLGALAAVAWGAADYFGGASGERTPVFVVVAVSELLGLGLLIPVLLARGVPPPSAGPLLLAAVAGAAVTLELSLIYLALSRGEGFITAPVSALGAAAAAAAGLLAGDPLGLMVAAGLACALAGGGVSAWTSDGGGRPGGPFPSAVRRAALCAGAAAGVATMLITLHAASAADPYWATAVEHASTGACAVAVVVATGRGPRRLHGRQPGQARRRRLPRLAEIPVLSLVAFAGAGGDLAYATASRGGALTVLSAVSSLYPVATIALGVVIRRLRPTRLQVAGITLALIGAAVLGFATG